MEEERQSLPPEATKDTTVHRREVLSNDPFSPLIEKLSLEKQKKLNLPDVKTVYRMLVDIGSETAGNIPPELHETIENVSTGFGFLSFDQLPDENKAAFIHRIHRQQKYLNKDSLTLTPEEAAILQRIASVMNIPYDPGRQEDDAKRIFPYAGIEKRMPDGYELNGP